jgi:proteasome assembly chaperone (PAC2) family protein
MFETDAQDLMFMPGKQCYSDQGSYILPTSKLLNVRQHFKQTKIYSLDTHNNNNTLMSYG